MKSCIQTIIAPQNNNAASIVATISVCVELEFKLKIKTDLRKSCSIPRHQRVNKNWSSSRRVVDSSFKDSIYEMMIKKIIRGVLMWRPGEQVIV